MWPRSLNQAIAPISIASSSTTKTPAAIVYALFSMLLCPFDGGGARLGAPDSLEGPHRRCSAPGPAFEEVLDERVLESNDFRQRRCDDDPLLSEHSDPIRQRAQGVDIVSHHHNSEFEHLSQARDEPDDRMALLGVETSGRFIHEQQIRLEHQGTSERHAFDHTSGELGRKLLAILYIDTGGLQRNEHELTEELFGPPTRLPDG